MKDLNLETLPEISVTYAKLKLAIAVLPFVDDCVVEALDSWFLKLLYPENLQQLSDWGIEVTVSANLDKFTCCRFDKIEHFKPRLENLFQTYEINNEQKRFFAQVLGDIQLTQIASWIELLPESHEIGWQVTNLAPLSKVINYAENSDDREKFLIWANHYGIQSCNNFGKSVVDEYAYTFFNVSLPHANKKDALVAILELFQKLELPLPSDTALNAFIHSYDGNIGVVIWLNEGGTVKLGVVLEQPSTKLVLQLCNAIDARNDEKLAVFEGCLGVSGASVVEYYIMADGFGVGIKYKLAS
jgi:hypothetical protein